MTDEHQLDQELRELADGVTAPAPEARLRARSMLLEEIAKERKAEPRGFRWRSGRGLFVALIALVAGSGAVAVATELASSPDVQRSATKPPVYGFEQVPDQAARRLDRRIHGKDRGVAKKLRRCRQQRQQSAAEQDAGCALLLAAARNGDLGPGVRRRTRPRGG